MISTMDEDDSEFYDRLEKLGLSQLAPKVDVPNESKKVIRRLIAHLEGAALRESFGGQESLVSTLEGTEATKRNEIFMRALQDRVDDDVYQQIRDEAASILLEASGSSQSEGRSTSLGNESPEELKSAGDSSGRKLQKLLDNSQNVLPPSPVNDEDENREGTRESKERDDAAFIEDSDSPSKPSLSGDDSPTESGSKPVEKDEDIQSMGPSVLQGRMPAETLEEQQDVTIPQKPFVPSEQEVESLKDEVARTKELLKEERKEKALFQTQLLEVIAELQLIEERGKMKEEHATAAEAKSEKQLSDTRQKLGEVERERLKLEERVRSLEEEASFFRKDILSSDRKVGTGARILELDESENVNELSFNVSNASNDDMPVVNVAVDKSNWERRLALMEAAQMVLQRDLKASERAKAELQLKLDRHVQEKKELEGIVVSLRQDLALTEMKATEASILLESEKAKSASLEAQLASEKLAKETSASKLASLTEISSRLEAEAAEREEELHQLQALAEGKKQLEHDCKELRQNEAVLKQRLNTQNMALKELDFERSKLKQYLILYEKELKKNESKVEQLRREFEAVEARRTRKNLIDTARTKKSEKHVTTEERFGVSKSTTPVAKDTRGDASMNEARLKSLEATMTVLRKEAAESAASLQSARTKLRRVQDENVRLRLETELSKLPQFSGGIMESNTKRAEISS